MVKKSTKSRPKRVTLGQKYARIRIAKQKIVKEKRKAKKEAKQRALQGGRLPRRKDPGVPSSWPFKEEFLKEMAFEKARIQAKKKQQKAERLAQRKDAAEKEVGGEEGANLMEALTAHAVQRQEDFDAEEGAGPDGEEGGIDRSYYKEFKKVVELADVVIQVLDARDPLPCRSQEVENFIRSCGPSKRIILLLNKIDLVPREIVEKWLKYLREEMPTVAFKSSTQKQHKNLGQAKKMGLGQGSKSQMCWGAENLLQLLKNYARNKSMKMAITVGVIGMPNVGKSSVINSLKRTRVAHVGNRPGVTTSIQEVHLDKHIRLLDSPGIIARKSQGALMGCVKTEQLNDPIKVIDEVLMRVSASKLSTLYNLGKFETVDEFLELLAAARGRLKRGGVPDVEAVAKIVLQDWNAGVIPYYTTPPARAQGASVQLVQEWGNDFDIDEVSDAKLLSNIKSLKDLEDSVACAMSSLGIDHTTDPRLDTAVDVLEGFTIADAEQPGTSQNIMQESAGEDGKEALPEFTGAAAGFEKMLERSADRKELGKAASELASMCMAEGANKDLSDAQAEGVGADHGDGKEQKKKRKGRKKMKVTESSEVKDVIAPQPKGLVEGDEDEDYDGYGGSNNPVEAATKQKRKKPGKNSRAEFYGNEGQLNPHKVRADRKKLRKVKRRQEKSVAQAQSDALKLAEAVKGQVNLGD